MSDRELLELAAKAYWGSEIDDVCSFRWDEQENAIVYTHADNQDHNGLDVELLWIPNDDDGDSLRLAVKLQMKIETYSFGMDTGPCVNINTHDGRMRGVSRVHAERVPDEDYLAATRRAIVHVAAEIGRKLK